MVGQLFFQQLLVYGEYIYSWGEKLKPESARTVQLQLTITPFLFDFNNSDSIKIDGITNFEIVYL